MRKSKFTDSQIMDAVKRVEAGFAVPDICRLPSIMARANWTDACVFCIFSLLHTLCNPCG